MEEDARYRRPHHLTGRRSGTWEPKLANTRMPAVFFGHGNPMNTLADNRYTQAWAGIGSAAPRPKAILAVSAHWLTRGTAVTAMAQPRTIHDFGGFPRELFEVSYPAPGDPALATRVQQLLAPQPVEPDLRWGLDHGTWSVLAHAYPRADVPVVQLSIDGTRPPQFHYDLARKLAPLRDEGVMIVGSGNVVHNLGVMDWRGTAGAYDWAVRFNTFVRGHIEKRSHSALIDFERMGEDARLSVPTSEHYLPLLYILGLQDDQSVVTIPVDGIEHGSISMMSVVVS
jgi:4,5-DOPA dioxygenase extradiol